MTRRVLKREYLHTLEKAADILISNPEAVAMIVGHTDSMGTADYNINLGKARASSVRQWLEEMGIEPRRIVISSMGEARPEASNETAEGRALNRRTVVEILSR